MARLESDDDSRYPKQAEYRTWAVGQGHLVDIGRPGVLQTAEAGVDQIAVLTDSAM